MKFRKGVQQILCFSTARSEITHRGTKGCLCMALKLCVGKIGSGPGLEFLVAMERTWSINEMSWPKGIARAEAKDKIRLEKELGTHTML